MRRLLFRVFPQIHAFLYRLTGGRLGSEVRGLQVLLLTTVGRKSSKARTTPLGFFRDGENFVIIGSNAGLDTHPAWYLNLTSHPRVTVQYRDRQMTVLAEVAGPEEHRRLWAALMQVAPGYADYQEQTKREIPLVILRPLRT